MKIHCAHNALVDPATLKPLVEKYFGSIPKGGEPPPLNITTQPITAERRATTWPDVGFFFARVAANQYVGKGGTDTGNRLFGTTNRGQG